MLSASPVPHGFICLTAISECSQHRGIPIKPAITSVTSGIARNYGVPWSSGAQLAPCTPEQMELCIILWILFKNISKCSFGKINSKGNEILDSIMLFLICYCNSISELCCFRSSLIPPMPLQLSWGSCDPLVWIMSLLFLTLGCLVTLQFQSVTNVSIQPSTCASACVHMCIYKARDVFE